MTREVDYNREAIIALRADISRIDATIAEGLKAAVVHHTDSLKSLTEEISEIRHILAEHVAKEDFMAGVINRGITLGFSATGALVTILLGTIGYLLVNPHVGL